MWQAEAAFDTEIRLLEKLFRGHSGLGKSAVVIESGRLADSMVKVNVLKIRFNLLL
jgi:hypothetical protein